MDDPHKNLTHQTSTRRRKTSSLYFFFVIILLAAVIVAGVIGGILGATTWKIYENKDEGFSIAYPGTWKAKENDNWLPNPAEKIGIIELVGNEAEERVTVIWANKTTLLKEVPFECNQYTMGNSIQSFGWETIQVNGEALRACHAVSSNGSSGTWESWKINKFFPYKSISVDAEAVGTAPLTGEKGGLS